MVLNVTASIGEWTSCYSTTHYDIVGAYLESAAPDLFAAIVGVANMANDECETMQAVASRLFRDREVDRVCPTVGGPVPEFSKEEFEALVYECIKKGSARIEVERNEGCGSYRFRYEWTFERGDVNRDVIFIVSMR